MRFASQIALNWWSYSLHWQMMWTTASSKENCVLVHPLKWTISSRQSLKQFCNCIFPVTGIQAINNCCAVPNVNWHRLTRIQTKMSDVPILDSSAVTALCFAAAATGNSPHLKFVSFSFWHNNCKICGTSWTTVLAHCSAYGQSTHGLGSRV